MRRCEHPELKPGEKVAWKNRGDQATQSRPAPRSGQPFGALQMETISRDEPKNT